MFGDNWDTSNNGGNYLFRMENGCSKKNALSRLMIVIRRGLAEEVGLIGVKVSRCSHLVSISVLLCLYMDIMSRYRKCYIQMLTPKEDYERQINILRIL